MRINPWLLSSGIIAALLLDVCTACPKECVCLQAGFTQYVRCMNFTGATHQRLPDTTHQLTIVQLKEALKPCTRAQLNVNTVVIEKSELNGMPLGWLFHCYPSVRYIEVRDSKLFILQNITFTTLATTRTVKDLSFSKNSMCSIEQGAFHALDQLKQLSITGDPLSIVGDYAFSGLSELSTMTIDLIPASTNPIPDNTFKILPKLNALTINIRDQGKLSKSKIPYLNLPDLKYLSISGNISGIEGDAFCNLTSLETLKLPQLETRDLSMHFVNCLPSLSAISLISNPIMSLNLDQNSCSNSVTNVNLYHNRLTLSPLSLLKPFPSLKILNLARNPISLVQVDQTAPRYNCNIETLSLYRCGIRYVPEDYFRDCLSLKRLNLHYNNIEFLTSFLPPNKEMIVRLDNNPLYCGCRLKGIELLILNEPTMTSRVSFTCSSRPNMNGEGIPYSGLLENIKKSWEKFRSKYAALPKCRAPVIEYFQVTDDDLSLLECHVTGDPAPNISIMDPDGRRHTFMPENWNQTKRTRRHVATEPGVYACIGTNVQGERTKRILFTSGDSYVRGNLLVYVLPPVMVALVTIVITVSVICKQRRNRSRVTIFSETTLTEAIGYDYETLQFDYYITPTNSRIH